MATAGICTVNAEIHRQTQYGNTTRVLKGITLIIPKEKQILFKYKKVYLLFVPKLHGVQFSNVQPIIMKKGSNKCII